MAVVDDDEDMMMRRRKDSSHKWWWIDNSSHSASPRSPWLHSTLSELDRKTKAMMKLIETDADSFAQRAEMYYKKRPELISMVQDFYKAQRLLVEQHDHQLQSQNRTLLPCRLLLSPTTSTSVSVDCYELGGKRSTTMSLSSHHLHGCKSTITSGMGDGDQDQQAYDCSKPSTCNSQSEEEEVVGDSDSAAESEVDNPDIEEDDICANKGSAAQVEEAEREYDEVTKKLKEEVEELKKENTVQKEQLSQKDEEKREVIRQLSLAMEILRLENLEARSHHHRVPFDLQKLKHSIFTKLFRGISNLQG